MKTWSCRLRRSQGRQPQRGCVPQPGVAPRHEGLPRESTPARRPNPEGVASLGRAGAITPAPPAQARRNPVGVGWNPGPLSPGSGGYAATRGYGMEPRWGSQGVTRSGNPTRARARWPRKRREEMGRDLPYHKRREVRHQKSEVSRALRAGQRFFPCRILGGEFSRRGAEAQRWREVWRLRRCLAAARPSAASPRP